MFTQTDCFLHNDWDISKKPHTKTKLMLLDAYFQAWFSIWLAQYKKLPKWLDNRLLYVDLFAGAGAYNDNGLAVMGSPLLFLKAALGKLDKIIEYDITIEMHLVDKSKANYDCLRSNLEAFLDKHHSLKRHVQIDIQNKDVNTYYSHVVNKLNRHKKAPLFIFIDPYGIKLKHDIVPPFLALHHKKDILFNFMTMAIDRIRGLSGETAKEISTIETMHDYFGQEIEAARPTMQLLENFIEGKFTKDKYHVLVYPMPYPKNRRGMYHLLFATRSDNIIGVADSIFSKIKRKRESSLFDPELTTYQA